MVSSAKKKNTSADFFFFRRSGCSLWAGLPVQFWTSPVGHADETSGADEACVLPQTESVRVFVGNVNKPGKRAKIIQWLLL